MRQNFHSGSLIASDGIVALWDAAGKRSYPGTGDKWSSPVNSVEATLYNSSDWDFVNEKGGFISFDGTNAYASVGTGDPGYDAINLTGTTISLCGWINRLNDSGYFLIVSKRAAGGYMPQYELNWYYSGGYGTGGYAQLTAEIGSNGVARSDTAAFTGWHYAVATYDGSTMRFYIDGQPWGSQSYSATISDNGRPLLIANNHAGAGTADGDIAVVKIYNRALTAAEVLQNYNATKWRFV